MRRSSRRLIRRTSRGAARRAPGRRTSRLRPNLKPSVGPPSRSATIGDWDRYIGKTLSIGTPVKVVKRTGHWRDEWIPEGARGEVAGEPIYTGSSWRVPVRIVDARDETGYPLAIVGNTHAILIDSIEPLVDNWIDKGRRRTSRHALPRSQRSWMKPNVIPEAPHDPYRVRNSGEYLSWVERTYAPETPVMFTRSHIGLDSGRRVNIPAGTKGVVLMTAGHPNEIEVLALLSDNGTYGTIAVFETEYEAPERSLRALEDNWEEGVGESGIRELTPGSAERSRMVSNSPRGSKKIDGVHLEVGDTVEMERHPVYDHPGDVPSYKVTKRKVKGIEWGDGYALVKFVGMRQRLSKGCYIDKHFRLGGSDERGWWLISYEPPSRYAILSVKKKG